MFDLNWIHVIAFQIINLNQTTPCFLNYTAGADMWQNCGADKDFLKFALMPFVWVTGGWFSMIVAAILIYYTWLKYQKVIYPIAVGTAFMPISYFLFPQQFLNFAIIMGFLGVGILIWWAFISQSNET